MKRLVAGAVAVVVLQTVPASAQLKARDEPMVSGPLTESNDSYLDSDTCSETKLRTPGGRSAGLGTLCWTFYRFSPLVESDGERDYGVWWVQADFVTKRRYCISDAAAVLDMGEDFPMSAAVTKSKRIRKPRALRMGLTAAAGGSANQAGTVVNSFTAFPGAFSASWRDDEDAYSLAWNGEPVAHRVALAGGVEGSWPRDGAPGYFLTDAVAVATRC